MAYPVKGCAEVNLHNPGLLPTLQCTLKFMRHTQECIAGTLPFLIRKLGGWKHTTAFHESYKTKRHRAPNPPNTVRPICSGNPSVVCNRGGRWTLRNWSDIGLSPANMEATQTKKPPKHCTEMGSQNISSSLQIKRIHAHEVRATTGVKV